MRILSTVQLKIPVVSVGNLSFGGTGKTPCIIFLAEELSKTYKINIITKSYKASLTEPMRVNLECNNAVQIFGDESCLIQAKVANCAVWTGPDKASTAIASMISQPELILLDDGFSHSKLKRNFDLVLLDATQGFNSYLREPLASLKRAQAVLITKANLASEMQIEKIKRNIIFAAPRLEGSIFFAFVKTELSLGKSSPLFIFCALGRPETFALDLTRQGYKIIHRKYYADHFLYSPAEQKNLYQEYLKLQQQHKDIKLVTTEKDFVKLSDENIRAHSTVAQHRIELDTDQKEALLEKIRQFL